MGSTFGFIGCGNMGGALAKATLNAVGCKNVYAADFDEEKLDTFVKENGVNKSTNEETPRVELIQDRFRKNVKENDEKNI